MTIFKEHPYDFQISKAFLRFRNTPEKVVFFHLSCNNGYLISFNKHRNVISKALVVLQHGLKSPTIIKLGGPLQEKDSQLKLVLCPEKNEIALYVKSSDQEYADYFHSKFCKNTKLWVLFDLQDGTYGILFDSDKYNIDYGFTWVSDYAPNPFDLMTMGLQSTFEFNK